jgi:RNA polymerase sigma-70 factor, ECF subfamily
MTWDERELARRFRCGDRAGFDAVYKRYAARVMGFALRLAGRQPEAEDLVQEVFLAAYAARATFQGRSSLLSWLLGIAARRWRDQCRRRHVETIPSFDDDAPEMAAPGSAGRSTIEEQVIRSLMLSQAVAGLEPAFREALLLVASQGLTYREAAKALGEPVGTVKWRVFEAMRRVRRLMDAGEEEADAVRQADSGTDGLSCGR